MHLPDVGLDCRTTAREYDWKLDLLSHQRVDEAAAHANEPVGCNEGIMGVEARASYLSLASAVGGVCASLREDVELFVESFSLYCGENCGLRLLQVCCRNVPVELVVVSAFLVLRGSWASMLSI